MTYHVPSEIIIASSISSDAVIHSKLVDISELVYLISNQNIYKCIFLRKPCTPAASIAADLTYIEIWEEQDHTAKTSIDHKST